MTYYWGPRQWYWYHRMSYNAPEKCSLPVQKDYLESLVLMTKLLPCMDCYDHFNKICQNKKIDFNTRENMIDWFIDVHNQVNKRLGKPNFSRENANELYQKKIDHLKLNQYIQYQCNRAIYGHTSFELVVKLMNKLIELYPCKKCRKNLKKYLSQHPLQYFGSNVVIFKKWFYNFFNNQDLGKHFENNWKILPMKLQRK